MRRANDSRTYAQWLREGWGRRPGFLQKRGMLVVESGCVISTGNGCCLKWLLTPAGNISRQSDTLFGMMVY
jgi:hypothetical protein